MGADALGPQEGRQAGEAGGADGAGRARVPRDDQGRLVVEDVARGGGGAGEEGIELDVDLIAERGALGHQVAAAAGQDPEWGADVIERRLAQAEAADGGAGDGGEVGVVGLGAGVGRPADLPRGLGMDDAGLEPGRDGGAVDGGVIVAGALDGDDEVAEVVVGPGPADAGREVVEPPAGLLDDGGSDEDVALEIGEHPFGAGLGAIDGDDAEVLGPDLLDPGMDGTRGLGDRDGAPATARGPAGRDGHVDTSGLGRRDIPKPAGSSGGL
jgi:hypothetical protein